ncbi:MAG TPA: protein-methionine-sulfoxide reductase catalytic subunit MsrP [Gemmata sp.]|jgi:sulfoxide reductase catalytic subunit YedY|nr:protein-methionine-sulfoxide reductase catalytic subunit MsrP [Gemmata sp.]
MSPERIKTSEITPEHLYWNRRSFLKVSAAVASAAITGFAYRRFNRTGSMPLLTEDLPGVIPASPESAALGFSVNEAQTPLQRVVNYNNFYEFTTDKEGVAKAAMNFVSKPWQVSVEGMVHKPRVFDVDEILKISPLEERIYRMRCVETWSMVIPWVGVPLSKLLEQVGPMGSAKYVAFESLLDSERMPGQKKNVLDWPYVEGLRLDEAMHPLTILAVGVYGRKLPPQNGAPLRLVVPWKYGFKGIKSIVKITLSTSMPPTTWNRAASNEYGFFANVNPDVPHPRWSQSTEQRLGESGRRATLPFNGYAEQVAHLYAGMDLRANF